MGGHAGSSALLIFEYSLRLQGVMLGASIVALTLGLSLLGPSLIRAKLYNKWLAWAGVVIFGFCFVGYIASRVLLYYGHDVRLDPFFLFGWLYVLLYYGFHETSAVYMRYMLQDVGAVIAIWLFVLGICHYRGR